MASLVAPAAPSLETPDGGAASSSAPSPDIPPLPLLPTSTSTSTSRPPSAAGILTLTDSEMSADERSEHDRAASETDEGARLPSLPRSEASATSKDSSSGQSEKPKTPLFNLLSPTPEDSIALFYRRFPELKDATELKTLERFSCTYGNKAPYLRGNLYITDLYLCFRARAFNTVSKLVIPFRDITVLESMKSVRHINAMRVIDRTDCVFIFSNFFATDREKAYKAAMASYAALSLPPLSHAPTQGRSRSASEPVEGHTRSFSDQPAGTGAAAGRSTLPRPTTARDLEQTLNPIGESGGSGSVHAQSPSYPAMSGPTSPSPLPKGECGCANHHSTVLVDRDMTAAPRDVFLAVFGESERACQPWLAASRQIGSEIGAPLAWTRAAGGDDGGASSEKDDIASWTTRTLEYSVKVPMVSKAVCYERQTISRCEEGVYVVNTSVQTPKIPYGDTFTIESRYCITSLGDGRTRMLLTMRVDVQKQVWITGEWPTC
ncbi:hypothetical protein M427DRAFT_207560 [Gonapodya prolifera JEL478]|uniref:VASt domain-containing protein n=1 Tax=Gonapodya prolifera (strain JEL478) TaxID=1344416 RepID=A0A139ANT2_GONPJ|nr:hypothetical protein M427DRAFT_207560 [Gonapodya prolifera JEL478]|eukprot:KXS18304.1 hypothetical protein M427DRAFT_207560 [Gonapodya prolifera JEL478]